MNANFLVKLNSELPSEYKFVSCNFWSEEADASDDLGDYLHCYYSQLQTVWISYNEHC